MSILTLVTNIEEAPSLVRWGAHWAAGAGAGADHYVLCCETVGLNEPLGEIFGSELENHSWVRSIRDSVDPKIASKLKIRCFKTTNVLRITLEQIREIKPELVIAGISSPSIAGRQPTLASQLAKDTPSDLLLLATRGQEIDQTNHVLIVSTNGVSDRPFVHRACTIADSRKSKLTVGVVEPEGRQAERLGKRQLRDVMSGADGKKKLKSRVIINDDCFEGVAGVADEYDLVALHVSLLPQLARLQAATESAKFAFFRKAPPIEPSNVRNRLVAQVPPLAPADYADLVQNLRGGSRWSADFRIMLALAALIASLGLLMNSPAVIIGSMLLAPLMTPMLAAGLALVQGNSQLARQSGKSISYGILLVLAISGGIGLIRTLFPEHELTPEITARTSPNLVDLVIALGSAAAGAYALARPTLAGSVAGVAIATALVPPLCTAGVCAAEMRLGLATGAFVLFFTNLVAIVLAAASVFYLMGVRAIDNYRTNVWGRPLLACILGLILILLFPLTSSLLTRTRTGVSQPAFAAVNIESRDAIRDALKDYPGARVILTVRRPSSLEYGADFGVYLAAEEPLPSSVKKEIETTIQEQMGDETLTVGIIVLDEHGFIDADGSIDRE